MKNRIVRCQLVGVLVAVALGSVGCNVPDTSGRNLVIEAASNQRASNVINIPTGPEVMMTRDVLSHLRQAESAGLVELRPHPWEPAGRIEVVGTPKLVGIALNPDSANPVWTAHNSQTFIVGEAGDNDPRKRWSQTYRVPARIFEAKIDKIVTDEEYKGSLASPGDKQRLILGTFRETPTSAAFPEFVGHTWLKQEAFLAKFRCIVQYSEFKKEWSVVALDVGSINPERWETSNVR
jgi:hypothetical protein